MFLGANEALKKRTGREAIRNCMKHLTNTRTPEGDLVPVDLIYIVTMSVSAGLSKDSGFRFLNTRYKAKKNITTYLYKYLYTF